MKKIYITILSSLFVVQLIEAQIPTLTKAFNEPIIGDVNNYKSYDSLSTGVPKNTGTGISWNFSAFPQNTVVASNTFSTPASVSSSSAYPGTTIVENQGNNAYYYYKSVSTPTTSFEAVGLSSPSLAFTFTNTAIVGIWPTSYGYSNTDLFSGNVTTPLNGTLDGTVVTNASGTGTLTIPGGTQFTNILQVIAVNTITLNLSNGFVTGTVMAIYYDYYHNSQKFPILTVTYQKQNLTSTFGPTVTTTCDIRTNSAVITGLNDRNLDATFQIFPDPAIESFNVILSNADNANGMIEIYNSVGQLTKTVCLGNASVIEQNISLSGLSSGIYIVKTSIGNKSSARRLIIE